MTTAGDVITYVKNDQRITDTSLDATLLAWLNKNLVRRTRGREYPQLRVEGTTFQTTANVSTYATPTGFLRLVPNSVMYGYSTSSAGYLLPDVNTDTAEAWKTLNPASDPAVVTVSAGTNGTKKLELLPVFTSGSQTVRYDYMAGVSTFTSTASTAQVPELLEVLAYDTIADYCRYQSRTDDAAAASQEASLLYRDANRGLIR